MKNQSTKQFAYFNGQIIPQTEVRIDPNDLGLVRGYAVFDALQTVYGQPFLLKEHFKRLQNSLRTLNLSWQANLPQFQKILKDLLSVNKDFLVGEEAAIKTMITGGISKNGLTIPKQPTVLITVAPLKLFQPPAKAYRDGGKIILVPFQRALPEIKTTNYLTALTNQKRLKKEGAVEMVYYYQNKVLEGSTSNIFIVKNKQVYTPNKDILPGTMKNLVVKLLLEDRITVKQQTIKKEDLLTADEIFLTGSFKNILPITRVEKMIIGKGKVGPISRRAITLLQNAMEIYRQIK